MEVEKNIKIVRKSKLLYAKKSKIQGKGNIKKKHSYIIPIAVLEPPSLGVPVLAHKVFSWKVTLQSRIFGTRRLRVV